MARSVRAWAVLAVLLGVLDASQTEAHTTEASSAARSAQKWAQDNPQHVQLPPDELAGLLQSALSDAAALKYDDMADAFLCRRCGAVLFSRSDLLQWADAPAAPLNLNSVRAEPALGPDALLPVFNDAGHVGKSNDGVASEGYMLFDLPLATDEAPDLTTILFKASSDPSKQLFEGYNSFPATCGECSASVGYFLSKESFPGSGEPQEGAGQGSPSPAASPLAPTATPPPAPVSTPPLVRPRAIPWSDGHLAQLFNGVCHVRHTGEWWSYEVCHGSGIAQLHLDQKGAELMRWSLGSHRPSMAAERVRAPAALYDIHRFKGGQHCDETGKGRSSKVQYKCCFPSGSAQEATSGVKADGASKSTVPHEVSQAWIANVVETSVCQYTIDMCVPALCEEVPERRVTESSTGAVKATATSTLSSTTLKSSGLAAVEGGGASTKAPFRFMAMSSSAVIPDTSEELAWLSAHSLQTGSK